MTRPPDRIADVRTYLPLNGKEGGDYHGRTEGHWIVDTVISNPMSVIAEDNPWHLRKRKTVAAPDTVGDMYTTLRIDRWHNSRLG